MASTRSAVWEFFTIDDQKTQTTCQLCSMNLSYNRSTSSMRNHLKWRHNIVLPVAFSPNNPAVGGTNTSPSSQSAGGHNQRSNRSPVWKYFTHDASSSRVNCIICDHSFSYKQSSSTTNMLVHLKSKHGLLDLANESSAHSEDAEMQLHGKANFERKAKTSLIHHIAHCSIAELHMLEVFSGPGVSSLVTALDPTCTIPPVEKSQAYMDSLYKSKKQKLLSLLLEQDHVAVSVEQWANRQKTTFLSIWVHFIDSEWQFQTYLLGTKEVPAKPDTLKTYNHEKVIRDLLLEFWILNKVVGIVCWNTVPNDGRIASLPVVVPAKEYFGKAVNEAVTNFQNNTIVNLANYGRQWCLIVHKDYEECYQGHRRELCLPHPVPLINWAKWFRPGMIPDGLSTKLTSLHWFVLSSEIIKRMYNDSSIKGPTMTFVFKSQNGKREMKRWEDMGNLLIQMDKILNHLQTIAKPMHNFFLEESSVVSATYPYLQTVANDLMNPAEGSPQLLNQFRETLGSTLQKILADALGLSSSIPCITLMASALDPRYKDFKFMKCSEELATKCKSLLLRHVYASMEGCEPPAKRARMNSSDSKLSTRDKAKQEVGRYLQEEMDQMQTPLEWWCERAEKFPSLAKLARKYLCVPASPPWESKIMYKRKEALPKDHTDTMLFLHFNQHLPGSVDAAEFMEDEELEMEEVEDVDQSTSEQEADSAAAETTANQVPGPSETQNDSATFASNFPTTHAGSSMDTIDITLEIKQEPTEANLKQESPASPDADQ